MTDRCKNVPQYDPDMVWHETARRLESVIIDADRLSLEGKLSREFEESFFHYVNDARKLLVSLSAGRPAAEDDEETRHATREELGGLLAVLRSDLEILRTRISP